MSALGLAGYPTVCRCARRHRAACLNKVLLLQKGVKRVITQQHTLHTRDTVVLVQLYLAE